MKSRLKNKTEEQVKNHLLPVSASRFRPRIHIQVLAFLLCLAFFIPAFSEDVPARRVFVLGETTPFADEAAVFDLYAAPLLGADCLLLGASGEWMLVDMGKESDFPVIRDMLKALGVTRVHTAFNTHPHSDHIGSMALLAGEFEIGRFITTSPLTLSGSSIRQRPILNALEALNVPVETMADGDTFDFGGARVQVMCEKSKDLNAASAALRVRFGGTVFLLGADISRLSQKRLAARYDLAADVLKYPHHGLEKLDRGFTDAVNPGLAIITHGSYNTKAAQKWLDHRGIPYLFATRGIIHLQSDGQKILLSQETGE